MFSKRSEKGDLGPREHVETNADAVAALLGESKEVVVVPGSARRMLTLEPFVS